MELHTYSSLSENFLSQYAGSMELADRAYVFFNPHAIELKRLAEITTTQVESAFAKDGLKAYDDIEKLKCDLLADKSGNCVVLFLSSGNFAGVDLKQLASGIIK